MTPTMTVRPYGTEQQPGNVLDWIKQRLPAIAIVGVSAYLFWHAASGKAAYRANPSRRTYESNKRGLTKSKLVHKIADQTGVEPKEVRATLAGLQEIVKKQLAPGGAGEVTIPGIAKLKRKHVKAKKRRKGINPFTGEEQWFKAKPATKKVKATILKDVRKAAAKKSRRRS